jgi:MFS family permease
VGGVLGNARQVRDLPPVVRLILASMVLFNIGFYLVVPFLAVHLSDQLHMAAWAVGLVLGVRTFSQQGLFFVGGSIADRFGARPVVLVGVALRVVGFVVLGFAGELWSVLAGAVLVGVAAALFAPAVESLNAAYGHRLELDGVLRRTELFGIEQMCSRLGSVVGPALGALLIAVPFRWTAVAAACLFTGLWVAFARLLPADAGTDGSPALRLVWRTVLGHRAFMVFVVLCAVQLLAYNQLYLMLPEQLERSVGSQAALGWFFTGAAVLVIAGQAPVVRLAHRIGHRRAIVAGLGTIALSFMAPPLIAGVAGLVVWVGLLHAGQMLMVPPMRDVIGRLAGERHLGAHFGMLSTVGGLLTLLGSSGVGWIYDQVDAGRASPALPWWALAATVAVAAGVLWLCSAARLIPAGPAGSAPAARR